MTIFYTPGWSVVTLTGGSEPEKVQGAVVEANLFSMLGVAAAPSVPARRTYHWQRAPCVIHFVRRCIFRFADRLCEPCQPFPGAWHSAGAGVCSACSTGGRTWTSGPATAHRGPGAGSGGRSGGPAVCVLRQSGR